MKDALHEIGWDDEDDYDTGEADEAALAMEESQTSWLDDKVYTLEAEGKKLKQACAERGLPTSGTKQRLLAKLHHFKLRLQWDIEAGNDEVSIKFPKVPSREVQGHHNLTHIPFESWCEACLATRTKENGQTASVNSVGSDIDTTSVRLMYTPGFSDTLDGSSKHNPKT